MTLLWQHTADGTHYEVHGQDGIRRLYANGILHSQYDPAQPVTGDVWDLLTLPAFFLADRAPLRICLLGVGGGTAIRQLRHWFPHSEIVGVDCNRVHLGVARRFFGATGPGVRLVRADAREWVQSAEPGRFDLVIDDLFATRGFAAERAFPCDRAWVLRLGRLLARGGGLVVNYGDPAELRASAPWARATTRRSFRAAFQLTTSSSENAIGAFLRRPADTALLRRRLRAHPELDTRLPRCRLDYRIRTLCRPPAGA